MIKYKIKFREYFLLLLPVFFVLHGYTQNYPLIDTKDVFGLLFTYVVVFVAMSFVCMFLLKSWRKATVFVLLIMCFHFFFGNMHNSLKWLFNESFVSKYVFILPLSFIFFIGAFIYLRKTKKEFRRIILYCNTLLIILVAFDIFQLAVKFGKTERRSIATAQNISNCASCEKPDIYFIIADEYAGNKELKDFFHFDNSAFENQLQQKGFFINDSSFSNYNFTAHSVASILSMNYLRNIEGRNQSQKDRNICHQLINQNQTIDLLKIQGYAIKNLSVFMFNNELPLGYSSIILNSRRLLTNQTFLSRLDNEIRFNLVATYKIESEMRRFGDMQLNDINKLLSETKSETSSNNNQPKFVYTHLMMPHYPYLLDSNGNKTKPEMVLEGMQEKQKDYISYLQYGNKRLLELVDFILKNSPKPPVIVLMGDHGFRHFTTDVPHEYYFKNFNAVYLPSKNYSRFYKGASGVNQLRILFNSVFDQHLPMLKDSMAFIRE